MGYLHFEMHYFHSEKHYFAAEIHYLHFKKHRPEKLLKVKYVKVGTARGPARRPARKTDKAPLRTQRSGEAPRLCAHFVRN